MKSFAFYKQVNGIWIFQGSREAPSRRAAMQSVFASVLKRQGPGPIAVNRSDKKVCQCGSVMVTGRTESRMVGPIDRQYRTDHCPGCGHSQVVPL